MKEKWKNLRKNVRSATINLDNKVKNKLDINEINKDMEEDDFETTSIQAKEMVNTPQSKIELPGES